MKIEDHGFSLKGCHAYGHPAYITVLKHEPYGENDIMPPYWETHITCGKGNLCGSFRFVRKFVPHVGSQKSEEQQWREWMESFVADWNQRAALQEGEKG